MSNGAPAAGDSDPQLVDALHRIYIESLPDHQRDRILELATDAARRIELPEALETLAASDLDQLHKWHVIASTLHRKPTLVEDDEIARGLVSAIIGTPDDDHPVNRDELDARLKEFGRARPQRAD
jgi:hypothetical protein